MSPSCICIAGPTASGKTAAAMAIAQHHAVEIISVDSALVYRGMDIGTAKPTRDELAAVPHHLVDIRDPLQAYSAAEFVADAERLIQEISARGRLPLLVGGTMLYFKALFDGLDDMPKADPAVRAVLAAEAAAQGWPALHAELARVDPVTAARLAPADSQRIQRALEVWQVSGRPLSSFHSAKDRAPSPVAASTALFSLEPEDRAWLHARGDLHPDLPSMRCVGYRQAWESLYGPFPMDSLRERGIAATRQLAKRQITWLRSMPARHAIACDQPDATSALVQAVLARLDAAAP